ncbi:TonB-dependent receptor plug domain-containing protein [Kordiimonas laminariae]|uniref:TonB-dependent receptor plug domain-containing protein n=1 Tax=Kordiimonas laminariae TaxID=2917717 RepID=UPI001FF0F822|nr:TonB-dependent receptor [Kordiimonas laminariae]MCK0068116.1 outer membrane beta-barrel protein [Kordiimonas laminariae]
MNLLLGGERKNALTVLKSATAILAITTCTTMSYAVDNAAVDDDGDVPVANAANTYPASFFDQYNPQNAFEMIQRLPGFSFDGGSNARGFGGNAGNVLIDGARPSSKSASLREVLIRIPVAQVERIEIVRGGTSAGDTAGQSVVANVIKKAGGTSGTWVAKLRRPPDGRVLPNVEGSLATKIGGWDTTSRFDVGWNGGNRDALLRDVDAEGNLIESEDETFENQFNFQVFSVEAIRDAFGGKLTVNGQFFRDRFKGDFFREGFNSRLPDGGTPDFTWQNNERGGGEEYELSVDWKKTFSNQWKLHSIILGSVDNFGFESRTIESEPFDVVNDITDFEQNRKQKEFILRSTYGDASANKFKPEFGFEVARNSLDSDLSIVSNGEAIDLSSANASVREIRGEAFANFNWAATKKLSVDGGLTGEISEIEVSGDAGNKQTFKFLKPRLTATYNFSDNVQWQWQIERTVGQLNFRDFAASAQINDDRTTAGNPDLAPNSAWELSTTFDWKFSERGSLSVNAFHEWRSDILEQIILASGDPGRGNAGNARFYGVEAELNIPLDFILPGGLLEIEANLRDASFDDPVTGQNRRISGFNPSFLGFDFRQDLVKAKVSWGIRYNGIFREEVFLTDQIISFRGNRRVNAFIETTRWFGVKTRFAVDLINTGKFRRQRDFFDPARGGAFTGSEISDRTRKPEFRIEVFGQF